MTWSVRAHVQHEVVGPFGEVLFRQPPARASEVVVAEHLLAPPVEDLDGGVGELVEVGHLEPLVQVVVARGDHVGNDQIAIGVRDVDDAL